MKMIHIIKSYIKFLWHSKNEHGVHSPFVFDLVTNCFYDKTNYPDYELLNDYRYELYSNKEFIDVTDFGAGSRIFKSNKRQISKIAKTAGISRGRARLLFRVVNYFQPENILEIGTSLGLATNALTSFDIHSKIITLEGCRNTSSVAQQLFLQKYKFHKIDIQFVVTEFKEYLSNLKPGFLKAKRGNWNLIYFDGNHSKKATLEYFDLLLPTVTNETVWIFDDIHWSSDMEEAWEIIKNHPKVNVTIDTFQWGLVFFRREQEKEHFVIRT